MMQFKHIRTRVLLTLLGGWICLELAGLPPVGATFNQHADAVASQQIEVGERVLVNLLQHNTQSHKQAAQAFAAENEFKEAINSDDDHLIRAALGYYQGRMHAQLAYFVSVADHVVNSEESPLPTTNDFNATATKARNASGALQFEMIQGTPYQLITVPVKAPSTLGWIVLGFKLEHPLSSKIKHLTHLDISLIQKISGHPWQLIDSSLSPKQSEALIQKMTIGAEKPLSLIKLDVDNKRYYLRASPLYEKNGVVVMVALQASATELDEALNGLLARMLGMALFGLAVFLLLSWYLARATLSPITTLRDRALEIADGEADHFTDLSRKDEFGQLGQALNQMSTFLFDRLTRTEKVAFTDALTGLRNRAGFMRSLKQALEVNTSSSQPFSVLVVNISRFKPMNTTFGRAFGDALLCLMAERIKENVFGERDEVARLDADTFAVLLHHSGQSRATQYAEKIRQSLMTPLQVMDQAVEIQLGIGIAIYPEHGQDESMLLEHAETAQQACKDKKAGWIVYHASLEINPAAAMELISSLQQALKQDELLLYIQPKVDIHSRKVLGGEALIRWVHPEKGMIFPDQFIPQAEKTGAIAHITLWVLQKACAVMAEFKQQGLNIHIAVNLSARDLHNSALPHQIATLLRQYGLLPHMLKLEITEHSLMEDPERAESVLRNMASLGLQIAIDDFGTGYSSLSHLRQLPVHELKIDKSFVMFMDKNPADLAIVKSTIDLGHNLGLNVIAEGIESEDVLNQLNKLGCNEGQGYFIGKPMPVRDFGIWLERWEGQHVVDLDLGQAVPLNDVSMVSQLDFNLDS